MPKPLVAAQAYYFEAPPEKVFRALTEPKMLVKWFLSDAKIDSRKGGSYDFDWIGGYHMTGTVKRFEANSAVSLSWTDKLDSGRIANTTVSFRVVKKGDGTLLKLRHTGFKNPVHFAECSARWGYYLTNLKSVLGKGKDLRSKHDW